MQTQIFLPKQIRTKHWEDDSERSNAWFILSVQCQKFAKAANGSQLKIWKFLWATWGRDGGGGVQQIPSRMKIPGGWRGLNWRTIHGGGGGGREGVMNFFFWNHTFATTPFLIEVLLWMKVYHDPPKKQQRHQINSEHLTSFNLNCQNIFSF